MKQTLVTIITLCFLFSSAGWIVPCSAVQPSPPPSAGVSTAKAFPELSRFLFQQAVRDWKAWKKTKDVVLLKRALFNVDSAISIDGRESEYWFVQGMLYSELKGDRLAQERALASFIRCIELSPGHGRGQFMVAEKLQELGKFDLAIAQYQFLMNQDPVMVNGMNVANLALCYLGAGKGDDGIADFQAMVKRYPRNADLRMALAVLLKAHGRRADAGDQLHQIIADKTVPEAKRENARRLAAQWKEEVTR